MILFFIVNQLIVFINLINCDEIGYHASAEEFDSFLNEYHAAWPKDVLLHQRQQTWNGLKRHVGHFRPRYILDRQKLNLQNIEHFEDQINSPSQQQQIVIHPKKEIAVTESVFSRANKSENYKIKAINTKATSVERKIQESASQKPHKKLETSVFSAPISDLNSKENVLTKLISKNLTNSSIEKNKSSLPIYFTNPATGIDYAIIEVGKYLHNKSLVAHNVSAIPIFITKEQYDRDLFLQRKYYENKCKIIPTTTTSRPLILRLSNFTKKAQIPAPINIRKAVTVNDSLHIQSNTQLLKKKRRPTRKPDTTKVKTLITTTTTSSYPNIIVGKRKAITNSTHTIPTQIENPITLKIKKNVRKRRSVNSTEHLTEIANITSKMFKLNSTLIENVEKNVGPVKSQRSKKKKKSNQVESNSNEYDLFDLTYEDEEQDEAYDSASDYDDEQHKSTVTSEVMQTTESTNPLYYKFKATQNQPYSRESAQYEEDYDYEENDSFGGVGSFFRLLFYPVQHVFSRVFDGFKSSEDETKPAENKYTTYTLYEQNSPTEYTQEEYSDEESSGMSNWLGSLFGSGRRTTKKIISATTAMPNIEPTFSWFGSWFGGSSNEESDEIGWFGSLFGLTPKPDHRTTTPVPVILPQVPILTIVDPHKNPQHWIGLLSSQIFNGTTTTAQSSDSAQIFPTGSEEKSAFRSYNKYQIWRLKPQTLAQVRVLQEYKEDDDKQQINWLRGPSLRGCTDVLLSPTMAKELQNLLNFERISFEVIIFDVGKVIAYEKKQDLQRLNEINQQKLASGTTMSWDKYYEYDDLLKYLESLRLKYAQNVELIHIGRSYEGRPLVIAKIFAKQIQTKTINGTIYKTLKMKKKSEEANAIFIEGGTHGLEWISPATSTWIINELLKIMRNNKTNNLEQEYIRNTTWYINPDGYVYSHDYDRFWRKTRSRNIYENDDFLSSAVNWLQQRKTHKKVCFGVDLDKNWSYLWGKRGTNKKACSANYAGNQPLSEPETKALSDFILEYHKNIKLYISLQAYGQVLKYPLRGNMSYNSEGVEDLLDVASVGIDGLRKKGSKSRYRVDLTNDLIEQRSGASDAFALYKANIPFAYTLYLADNGVHGYLLPSSSIEYTARDAFKIIISLFDYIYEL